MKIKTKDLIGPALDWAVAKCIDYVVEFEGYYDDEQDREIIIRLHGPEVPGRYAGNTEWHPSADWSQGGPIKTKHLIATEPRFLAAGYEHPNGKWVWQAHLLGSTNIDESHEQEHESELIAAMRCYVASKLGDEVEIPDTLIKE